VKGSSLTIGIVATVATISFIVGLTLALTLAMGAFTFEQLVFSVAAAGAIEFSILVVALPGTFRATVSLIGALLSVAVLFVLLTAPFVAVIQVIVYAGAIVVLFLFVIAYMGERPLAAVADPLVRWQPVAWLVIVVLAAQALVVLLTTDLAVRDELQEGGTVATPGGENPDFGGPEAIGRSFIDDYIVPFEATSLVLLVAAVGAVLLAKRAVQLERGR
jgi:NADH:ubiquinone oxidoreductase subunit 6 (subunit J)